MGYRSNFYIRLFGDTGEFRGVRKDIETQSGYKLDPIDDDEFAVSDANWPSATEDLKAVAARHPDILFSLSVEGEDRNDNWSARFKGQEYESRQSMTVTEPFEKILLPFERKQREQAQPDESTAISEMLEKLSILRRKAACILTGRLSTLMKRFSLEHIRFSDYNILDTPIVSEDCTLDAIRLERSKEGDIVTLEYSDEERNGSEDLSSTDPFVLKWLNETLDDEFFREYGITDFFFIPEEERKLITDSLLLDSGQEILAGSVGDINVSVIVCGEVRVGWKGQIYRSASQYPDDLAEAIRTGSFHVGRDENDENFIGNNNWFEVRVWRNKTLLKEDIVDIDLSSMSDDDARDIIFEYANYYREEEQR